MLFVCWGGRENGNSKASGEPWSTHKSTSGSCPRKSSSTSVSGSSENIGKMDLIVQGNKDCLCRYFFIFVTFYVAQTILRQVLDQHRSSKSSISVSSCLLKLPLSFLKYTICASSLRISAKTLKKSRQIWKLVRKLTSPLFLDKVGMWMLKIKRVFAFIPCLTGKNARRRIFPNLTLLEWSEFGDSGMLDQ